jgi:hypothetical protein
VQRQLPAHTAKNAWKAEMLMQYSSKKHLQSNQQMQKTTNKMHEVQWAKK